MLERTPVVTVFLRHRGEVLLLRRSEAVGSYVGRWGTVAGHVATDEGVTRDPTVAARAEIREETGIPDTDVSLVRAGDPFDVDDDEGGFAWRVHPFLFDSTTRAVEPNEETTEFEWCPPTALLRRETVPRLWTSYDRVRPTPETVAEDTEHGSAYLSYRALECLRDEAALRAVGRVEGSVEGVARRLLEARPAMAVVENRVNRAMARVTDPSDPEAVERAASETLEAAFDADERAAAWPDSLDAPDAVLTLSRSGTVRAAVESADPSRVFVAESRPAREGVGVAESLADGREVTLHTDAAIGHVLATESVDAVVVGADAVLADGSVVNKTGTRLAALAAANEDVPVYVVCAADKVTAREDPHLESGPDEELYDGPAPVSVLNPTFDVTPADLVTGVLTERGVLDGEGVREVAADHAERAAWDA